MFSYNVWHTFYQRKLGINQICFGLSKQTLGGDKRCFWKGFVDFLLIQQKHTFNDDLVVISPDWVKRLYMMLILRDETALITEIFIAGFILWLVNIHRYTPVLPILSAPSGINWQELPFSFWWHNDCQAFSRYTALYSDRDSTSRMSSIFK